MSREVMAVMKLRAYIIGLALVALAVVACAEEEAPPPAPAAAPAAPVATPTPTEPQELIVMTHDSFDIGDEVIKEFERANNAKVVFQKAGDAGEALVRAMGHGRAIERRFVERGIDLGQEVPRILHGARIQGGDDIDHVQTLLRALHLFLSFRRGEEESSDEIPAFVFQDQDRLHLFLRFMAERVNQGELMVTTLGEWLRGVVAGGFRAGNRLARTDPRSTARRSLELARCCARQALLRRPRVLPGVLVTALSPRVARLSQ